MAVSFDNAASENQVACFHGESSRYAARPQNVKPAAGKSICAKELCVKNTGYKAVSAMVAHATETLAASRESRHNPSNENAATASMAVRVVSVEYPVSRHASASHAITSGGWAFEIVVCGMSEPVRYRSRAAGT